MDTNRPTVAITAPANGRHQTNALARVAGTAADNWKVTAVWCQLNSNDWALAVSTNRWTNWSALLTLAAGTNTIRAYATDPAGNPSLTNSVSVLSSNAFRLWLGFTNPPPTAGSGCVFRLECSTGLWGQVEVSTNLANWAVLTNFIGSNGVVTFRDPGVANGAHFYRAVVP